jgi:hypothetical protein
LTSNCNLTHSHSREYICLRMKHDAQKGKKCKKLLSIVSSNQPPLATELPNIKNVFSVFYSCSFHISFRIQFSHFDNLLFFSPFFFNSFKWKKALTAARHSFSKKKWKHINNIHRRDLLHKFRSRHLLIWLRETFYCWPFCVFSCIVASQVYNSLQFYSNSLQFC